MRTSPRDTALDRTLDLWREGYGFIGKRCDRLGTEIFQSRLLLRPVICMRGAEAAEVFYAGDRFTRVGAMPVTVLKLLQDYGSVQLLDGAAHRRRKQMFVAIGSTPQAALLASLFADEWYRSLRQWEQRPRDIVLFDELQSMLTRAALAWSGIAFDDDAAEERAHEFAEMVEATGSVGPRNWRALWLRRRAEHWARGIVAEARARPEAVPRDCPLGIIAAHRDLNGSELDQSTAAVELLNVLRAVAAVRRFIVYTAKALHEHPASRRRILAGDMEYLGWFVQEVRRLSPFFPFIAGRVRRPFEWRGYPFARGAWVILDLYGTNRDPQSWGEPEAFRPERFRTPPGAFQFVPQGAGHATVTHRCPGEELTLHLMGAAAQLLAGSTRYEIPDQDLSVDLARIPAVPRSGFVMARPRRVAGPEIRPVHVTATPS